MCCKSKRDFKEAGALLQQTVADLRDTESFGDSHPETLDGLVSLAFCLSSPKNNLNRCEEAEKLFRDALNELVKTQGEDDLVPWRFKHIWSGLFIGSGR